MLMITYCFFLRDMLEPQVPQERLENEEQEYVPPLLSAFCFIFLFFLFPTSFWRMLYHLLVSLAVFHQGCRSILLSLLGGVLQKIPENSWGENWSSCVKF